MSDLNILTTMTDLQTLTMTAWWLPLSMLFTTIAIALVYSVMLIITYGKKLRAWWYMPLILFAVSATTYLTLYAYLSYYPAWQTAIEKAIAAAPSNVTIHVGINLFTTIMPVLLATSILAWMLKVYELWG